MRERDQAQQNATTSGLAEDWDQYKILRNQVTALLRKDKFEWHKEKLQSCEETMDTGKLW